MTGSGEAPLSANPLDSEHAENVKRHDIERHSDGATFDVVFRTSLADIEMRPQLVARLGRDVDEAMRRAG